MLVRNCLALLVKEDLRCPFSSSFQGQAGTCRTTDVPDMKESKMSGGIQTHISGGNAGLTLA
jgi:hypothetical protein